MHVHSGHEAAKSLLARRLPARALQYMVHTGEVRRDVLQALGITDQTIRGLLAARGVPVEEIVEEAMQECLAPGERSEDGDPWDCVDPAVRMENNPLLVHVRRALAQCTGTGVPGE